MCNSRFKFSVSGLQSFRVHQFEVIKDEGFSPCKKDLFSPKDYCYRAHLVQKKFTEYRRHLGSHLKIMFWSKYFEPRHPLTVAWNIETRASISCNPLRPVLLLPCSRSSNVPIPCWPVLLLPFSRSSNLPIPAVLLLFFPSSNPSL